MSALDVTPLVSCDPVLLESIETDEHLEDLETSNMHGKRYVSENNENIGDDTTHAQETDE